MSVQLLANTCDPRDVLDRIEQGYVLGYHKAAKMAEIARWAQMWAVTSFDLELMKSIFIRPFPTVQQAFDAAVAGKGRERILFMMVAIMTVLRLRRRLIMRPRRFIYGSRWNLEEGLVFYEDSVQLPKSERIIVSLMER